MLSLNPKSPRARGRARLFCLVLLAGCAAGSTDAAAEAGCRILQRSTPLPDGISESSGVAAGRARSAVFWTHNDSGGDPVLFGVQLTGQLVQRVRVRGAEMRDWEDIAAGPCPSGSCLFIADTGDNDGKRSSVSIYRVPEPAEGAAEVRAERFPVRYPDGAHDAEALFVLSTGEVFLVTKGRNAKITLYRYPGALRAGETVTLERVGDLSGSPVEHPLMVTGAAASPSGEWVAIRRYQRLELHRSDDLRAGRLEPVRTMDLTPVGEAQGEAVELLDDGRVVLTSEGGFKNAPGTIAAVQCSLAARGDEMSAMR